MTAMLTLPRFAALTLALGGLLGTAGTASAAWNNVFQVCCHDCNKPRVSYSVPCPQPCPQPEMRISYVQRSYYQPVTEYVRKSYYEPVTKNVTTYYQEPVTEYKYSTYYDPCTGCPQQVCTPVTSYRLRSKCNAVTSFVERCAMVPVTTLKPVTVRQPVVSYYYPPEPICPPSGTVPQFIPPAGSGASVEEQRGSQPGVMQEGGIPPTNIPTGPGGTNAFPKTLPGSNVRLKPEKTVSRSSVVSVRGEVVKPDQLTPIGGTKLVFVSADDFEKREYATANTFGEFDVRLGAGNWHLYVGDVNGRANYHKQISLGDRATVDYKVVSR
jgi:hypothetical protein